MGSVELIRFGESVLFVEIWVVFMYNTIGDYMGKVFRIALTGGPCSGKTTLLNELKKIYSTKGFFIITVSESARELLSQGISRDDMLEFETLVAERQIENEEKAEKHVSDSDTIIFYDRGLNDAFSYLDDSDKKKLKQHLGISSIEAWNRYDAVLFLETSAVSDCYEKDSYRIENADDAVRCHYRTLEEWMGHPHLRYIKAEKNIEDKKACLIREVECIVNNTEQEIKYLITYPPQELFERYICFKTDIEQIYLLSDTGTHRIRKRGAGGKFQYFETFKYRLKADKCIEYEKRITKKDYDKLSLHADPNKKPIIKNRYCLLYNAQYFEIDVFPFWNDRALLELEISHDGQEADLPKEITVIKDVSKDKKYKNNYLAGLRL